MRMDEYIQRVCCIHSTQDASTFVTYVSLKSVCVGEMTWAASSSIFSFSQLMCVRALTPLPRHGRKTFVLAKDMTHTHSTYM